MTLFEVTKTAKRIVLNDGNSETDVFGQRVINNNGFQVLLKFIHI